VAVAGGRDAHAGHGKDAPPVPRAAHAHHEAVRVDAVGNGLRVRDGLDVGGRGRGGGGGGVRERRRT
jgi:hypothetical protein